jgi:predicted ester cyclase
VSDAEVAVLVHRFYDDIWNAWDDELVDSTLSEDFRFRGSLGHETEGRDGFRSYRDGIRRACPDFRNEIRDLVVTDDRAAVRLEWSGTHTGDMLGFEPTHRPFRYPGAALVTVGSGLLTVAWVVGDLSAMQHPES